MNDTPKFKRPKRIRNGKQYTIVLPPEDVAALEGLLSDHAALTGVRLSTGGLVRVAIRRLKEQLENETADALLDDNDPTRFDRLRQAARREATSINYMPMTGFNHIKSIAEMNAEADASVKALRESIEGLSREEARQFLRTGKRPEGK